MSADWIFVVAGWLLAGLAGTLWVRFNPAHSMKLFRNSDRRGVDWRVSAPFFVGMFVSVVGGAGLQKHLLGYWAIPLTYIPLFLAFALPSLIHRRLTRRSRSG